MTNTAKAVTTATSHHESVLAENPQYRCSILSIIPTTTRGSRRLSRPIPARASMTVAAAPTISPPIQRGIPRFPAKEDEREGRAKNRGEELPALEPIDRFGVAAHGIAPPAPARAHDRAGAVGEAEHADGPAKRGAIPARARARKPAPRRADNRFPRVKNARHCTARPRTAPRRPGPAARSPAWRRAAHGDPPTRARDW